MKAEVSQKILDKFLNEREGEYGITLEYLYSDFSDNEESFQLAKRWIEAALVYGFELGQISAHRENCKRCKKDRQIEATLEYGYEVK